MKSPWFNQVKRIADETTVELHQSKVLAQVIAGKASKMEYAEFLHQTFHYVRYSKPIMAACALRLRELGGRADMIGLFEAKADEENGHEAWALDDLEALGLPRSFAEQNPPSPAVCEYLAWNIRMAQSDTPLGFLGTAYVLEFISHACAGLAAKNLATIGAIPNIDSALSFLSSHGEADQEHIRVLDGLLGAIEGRADRNAILWSAVETRRLYPRFFQYRAHTGLAMTHGLQNAELWYSAA